MYFCQKCGAQSAKWIGKCPSCGEWNTYVEEVIQRSQATHLMESQRNVKAAKPIPLMELVAEDYKRIVTSDQELNRVLGGGIVQGSIVLIAGEPGIGKSTLLLQLALNLEEKRTLYVSGEESPQQVKMRADRIGIKSNNCYVLSETNTSLIFQYINELQPELVIIDSIQTLQTNLIESAAGSISQIKECAAEFMRYAKESGTPVFLIGHINKEGTIAGPKVLEHMVDSVIQFEGDRHYTYRILRTLKNRFGSASELGIYEMHGEGLREVSNPSEILITQRNEPLSGIAIAATLEGMRPLLIEVQALVTPAVYGNPQRTVTGFDTRRLSLLLAVLEKRCGFPFAMKDVFLNIAGGIKIEDPATDLAIVAALISSFNDSPVPPSYCFAAEVGLSGEIRAVNRIEQRISEVEKLGFKHIVISNYNKINNNISRNLQLQSLSKVEQLIRLIF